MSVSPYCVWESVVSSYCVGGWLFRGTALGTGRFAPAKAGACAHATRQIASVLEQVPFEGLQSGETFKFSMLTLPVMLGDLASKRPTGAVNQAL